MTVIVINNEFSVCKLPDFSGISMDSEFYFCARTDDEFSLVCPSDAVPYNSNVVDNGWRMFRIDGVLDFSLVGILSKITTILAESNIPVFAVSTFDTDYLLTKSEKFDIALNILKTNGYTVIGK